MRARAISPALHDPQGGHGTRLAYWVLQLTGWSLYFYAQASGEVAFASAPWSKAVMLWGAVCLSGLGLTHLLRWVVRRHAWLSLPPVALLARIVAAALLISLIAHLITTALSLTIYDMPVAPIRRAFYRGLPLTNQLFNSFVSILTVNVLWMALYFGFTIQRHRSRGELRQAQLGAALQTAELRLLKSQLNPHFLFNALNAVRALIADEPARAQDAVTHLARALRYALASGEEDLVSLARELEMVEDYLALESLRLAERLNVVREIEPAATTVYIPMMLLQTLVENAIKHGIAPLRQGGTLRIAARAVDSQLVIQVVNPRPAGPTVITTQGVGLRNSARRLQLLFGSKASAHLDLSDPNLATAEIRLPL